VEEGADGAPDSASIDAGSIVDVEADASPEASCCSSEDQTCCLLDAAYGGSPFDGDEPPLPTDATTDAGPGPGDASQDH
jgi:SET domain-containing protein